MATQDATPLPQYYGQKLQDGTIMESPKELRHTPGSGESRQELLRLPAQPHAAHIDGGEVEPDSPTLLPSDPNAVTKRSSSRRIGGHPDPNDLGTPVPVRHQRRTQSQDLRGYNTHMTHRSPYVEDYPSDEEYDAQVYRRRPSRQYRPPPSVHANDPRTTGRFTALPGRGAFDANGNYYNDRPRYRGQYSSDDEYAQRSHMAAAGGGYGNRPPPPRKPSHEDVMRLPWAIWMGSNAKNHFVAFVGEFVGTTMFLFFAFSGVQVANIGSSTETNTTTGEATGFSIGVLMYISVVFAFSLMVNVWVFFRISGGLFNPAVTFAMLLVRAISPVRAALLLAAQIAGAIFSSYIVSILFPTDFNVRTTLSEGTSLAQGVFIEAMLTFELVFTIFMLAKEKHKGRSLLLIPSPLHIHPRTQSNPTNPS